MYTDIPFIFDNTIKVNNRCFDLGGSLLEKGPWDKPFLEMVYKELKKIDSGLFIDIGANTGEFTLLAKYLPQLDIFSVEPGKQIYEALCDNVAINGLNNVQCFNCALSDFIGDSNFRFMLNWCGMSCINPPDVDSLRIRNESAKWVNHKIENEKVTVRTLDSLIDERGDGRKVRALKIDVEGCELSVLKGGIKTLSEHKPLIIVEYVPENTANYGYHPDEILNHLKWLGYKSFQKTSSDYIINF